MTEPTTNSGQPADAPEADVIARAGRYYRNARYLIALLCIGLGIWFFRDGFFIWPAENAAAMGHGALPHPSAYDIPLQKTLGLLLPPLGLLVLGWTLYHSRGQYRLAADTLHIPGHPPVPLDAIRRIDKSRWDKKGIAQIDYELSTGQTGQFTLDDFVYDRDPTDRIFDRIEAYAQSFQDAKTDET